MKKPLLITLVIVGIVIILAAGVGAWAYHGPVTDQKQSVLTTLSLPAAKVGGSFVSAKDVFTRYKLVQALQPQGQDIKKPDLEKLVLDKFIEEKKLSLVAHSHNVSPSNEDIAREYQAVVNQLGGGDETKFKKDTLDKYNLSSDQFKEQILASNILYSKLNVWYNSQSNLNPELYNTLSQAQGKLNGGADFATVAKEYSQDSATKDLGGDAGFLNESDLLPEFASVVNGMNKGDVKTIPSRYGVHIVKYLDSDTSNGQKRVHLQQIFLSNTSFEKWLGEQTSNIPSKTYIRFS